MGLLERIKKLESEKREINDKIYSKESLQTIINDKENENTKSWYNKHIPSLHQTIKTNFIVWRNY